MPGHEIDGGRVRRAADAQWLAGSDQRSSSPGQDCGHVFPKRYRSLHVSLQISTHVNHPAAPARTAEGSGESTAMARRQISLRSSAVT